MKIRNAAVLLLSTIPLVAVLVYIGILGQGVPFWDEWIEPLAIAVKTAEGTLSFSDLIRQYNDTRPFFTNLLTSVSTYLFGWDLKLEMYFNVFLASVSLLMAYSICRRHLGRAGFPALPLLSLLTFSLTQHWSWLWSIQSQYFFLIFFFILALWRLESDLPRRRWTPVVTASVLALFMTFSYANGFLAWIVLPLVMWLLEYRRPFFYVYWLLATAVGLASYFHRYELRVLDTTPDPDPILHVQFLLAFLGNALVAFPERQATVPLVLAGTLGALGLGLFSLNVFYLVRRDRNTSRVAVWIGMAALVLASGVLISIGRVLTRGLAGALAGRYVTLSMAFWIALVCLGAHAVHESLREASPNRLRRLVLAANSSIGILLTSCLLYFDCRAVFAKPRVTPAHRICLAAVPETRDLSCLRGLHDVFDPRHPSFSMRFMALDRIDRLSELELGVFADPDTVVAGSSSGLGSEPW